MLALRSVVPMDWKVVELGVSLNNPSAYMKAFSMVFEYVTKYRDRERFLKELMVFLPPFLHKRLCLHFTQCVPGHEWLQIFQHCDWRTKQALLSSCRAMHNVQVHLNRDLRRLAHICHHGRPTDDFDERPYKVRNLIVKFWQETEPTTNRQTKTQFTTTDVIAIKF